ncbi:hypothetical protein G6F31_016878 [Rhizopus arrhizus]|nr:hypothetical protein G6F31_016878 [Rhizopus arrhizus]
MVVGGTIRNRPATGTCSEAMAEIEGGALDQAAQAGRHVAHPADLAHRVQVGVVRAFMGPAQALCHLGQRGDLDRFRAALETVRQDAGRQVHAAMLASPDAQPAPARPAAAAPALPRPPAAARPGRAGDGGDPLHRAARPGDGPRVRRARAVRQWRRQQRPLLHRP